MGSGWIDVSVPLRNGMVNWPENPPFHLERVRDVDRGASSTLSVLSMGSHTGTHVDAPRHFLSAGAGIDRLPLDAVLGPARVIGIRDPEVVRREELVPQRIRRGERLLLKTRNSSRAWKSDAFVPDFVYVPQAAAEFLVERGVRVLGVDYLSVGGYRKDGGDTHRALLEAGIWIIEGLNLARVKPGRYDLICLPLCIMDADGAPARALLRPRGG